MGVLPSPGLGVKWAMVTVEIECRRPCVRTNRRAKGNYNLTHKTLMYVAVQVPVKQLPIVEMVCG